MAETTVVGTSVVRTDAAAKVRGGAVFGVDVRFGGMLVGKTLRAGVPHARIVNLDTSAASKVPGVRAIVTGRDCSRRHGLFQKDQPALAIDRVRYAGEVVASGVRMRLAFPSEHYEEEYGAVRRYLPEELTLDRATIAAVAEGQRTPQVRELLCKRIVLDMPERYY